MTALVTGLIITSLRQVVVQCRANGLFRDGVNRFYLQYTFSTSSSLRGLEEFFPPLTNDPNDLVEESEKAGRPWKKNELRLKSNDDLHKLWYVLLKEHNKLLTLDHEAKRIHVFMPGGERLKKVKTSMDRLKQVINERDRAVRKARRLIESQGVNEDLARVLRVMEYNIGDLPDITPPPDNKDKRPIMRLVHKKRKL